MYNGFDYYVYTAHNKIVCSYENVSMFHCNDEQQKSEHKTKEQDCSKE